MLWKGSSADGVSQASTRLLSAKVWLLVGDFGCHGRSTVMTDRPFLGSAAFSVSLGLQSP
jgi:hypothetical protein